MRFFFLSRDFLFLLRSLSLSSELGDDDEESDEVEGWDSESDDDVEDVDEEGVELLSVDEEPDEVEEIDGDLFLEFFEVPPLFLMTSGSLAPSVPLVPLLEPFLRRDCSLDPLPGALSLLLSKSFVLLNKTPDGTLHLSGRTVTGELLTSRVSAKHTRRVSVKVWVVGLCSSGVGVGWIQRSQQR